MDISLKNVEYSPRNSQETMCFYAEIFIDGKPAMTARNDGRGGMSFHDPHPKNPQFYAEAEKMLLDWGKTLPPMKAAGREFPYDDLDMISTKLVSDHLAAKELTKMIRSKVVMVEAGQVFTLKPVAGRSPSDAAVLEAAKRSYPNATILNSLPFDEAVKQYIAAGEGA